jgi:hypothetical protein
VRDPSDRDRLHAIARRLGRSELLYVGQAVPWTPPHRRPALATLQEIVTAETQGVHTFLRWLLDQRMPIVHLGAFPMELTSLSYLGLDHLLPRLLTSEQSEIKTLAQDLAALTNPAARAEVEKLLERKKGQVFRLEVLVSEGRE